MFYAEAQLHQFLASSAIAGTTSPLNKREEGSSGQNDALMKLPLSLSRLFEISASAIIPIALITLLCLLQSFSYTGDRN